MKKMVKILTLVLALMLCMTTASAGIMVTNVSVPELGMDLYIPPYLNILTRDMNGCDDLLAQLGMDRGIALEYMESNQLYVDAFPSDFSYELTVASEPNDISNFRDYGDPLLDALCEQMAEIYADIGITVTATDIYKNDAADYVKIYYDDPNSGACVLQYYTIVGNKAVNFRIFHYGGAVTADDESIIKIVVDNAVYNDK